MQIFTQKNCTLWFVICKLRAYICSSQSGNAENVQYHNFYSSTKWYKFTHIGLHYEY